MKLAPDDPWVQSLAGRVALERGEYELAVERLRTAIRLRPGMIEAHEGLAKAYAAAGRKQEAAAEFEKAKGAESDAPPYLGRLFQGNLR